MVAGASDLSSVAVSTQQAIRPLFPVRNVQSEANAAINEKLYTSRNGTALCNTLQLRYMHAMASQITSNSSVFNSLFRLQTNKTLEFRVTDPLWGESTGDRWIPSIMACNAGSVILVYEVYTAPQTVQVIFCHALFVHISVSKGRLINEFGSCGNFIT